MNEQHSTILIVDDDTAIIERLTRYFRRLNYEPIATANPAQVEKTLQTFEVDLIVLDLRMEKLSGYDVLQNLRAKGNQVPVLIITAYLKDERENLKKVGITEEDVIEKPFQDLEKVEALLRKKLSKVVLPGEVGSEYEGEMYSSNRAKVMVVDDEEEITDLLRDILESKNYEVTTFGNGKTALDFVQRNQNAFHIAVVDMAIPGLSGHKLIQEMLKINPKIKMLPISARYENEMKATLESVGLGSHKFLLKPFRIDRFVEEIKVLAAEAGLLG